MCLFALLSLSTFKRHRIDSLLGEPCSRERHLLTPYGVVQNVGFIRFLDACMDILVFFLYD